MENVVVIAEDPDMRSMLVDCAESLNFRVFAYHNSQQAERLLLAHRPALVIAELSSRKVDGLGFTRDLRTVSDISVILLSSSLDEVEYVLGSQAGADRIVKWPASRSLISVTISAVNERYNAIRHAPDAENGAIDVGNLHMEPQRHFATWKNCEVRLTATEFKILARLVRRAGAVKSRDDLMGADCSYEVNDRYVDSHIKRIRAKLRNIDADFSQIETLYGVGYRYVEETAAPEHGRESFRDRELRIA